MGGVHCRNAACGARPHRPQHTRLAPPPPAAYGATRALSVARDDGVAWLASLEADELLHPAGDEGLSVAPELCGAPPHVPALRFMNAEAVPEGRGAWDHPFESVTLFRAHTNAAPAAAQPWRTMFKQGHNSVSAAARTRRRGGGIGSGSPGLAAPALLHAPEGADAAALAFPLHPAPRAPPKRPNQNPGLAAPLRQRPQRRACRRARRPPGGATPVRGSGAPPLGHGRQPARPLAGARQPRHHRAALRLRLPRRGGGGGNPQRLPARGRRGGAARRL